MKNKIEAIFQTNKPIIGMIHLAGTNRQEKVKRALEELVIYQEEGLSGAIIEDYQCSPEDVTETLKQSSDKRFKLVRGVNVLRNPYSAFGLAAQYGAKFIQFDSVQTSDLNLKLYDFLRKKFPNIAVLGGIGFKYTLQTGNHLEIDLREGKLRCDAIVTTGSGTGIETPTNRLIKYKKLLGDFPLIVRADVNSNNVHEQLKITDGAIIDSYFKPDKNTQLPVDRMRVRKLIDVFKRSN